MLVVRVAAQARTVARVAKRCMSGEGASVSLTFVDQEGNEKGAALTCEVSSCHDFSAMAEVPATVGKTVLDAALASNIDIEAAYVLRCLFSGS